MPVSRVPSRTPMAGDSHSGLLQTRVGAVAVPRGLVSGGVCGLACVGYPQLPAMSGSASLREQV